MNRWNKLVAGEIQPGVYRLPPRTSAAAVRRAVEPGGWRVFGLEGREITDKPSFLRLAAEAMEFPSYFGKNWDAFEESLNDLEWAPAKGYVVLYPHADRFASSPEYKTALSIFREAVQRWQARGTPFFVFIGGVGDPLPELEA